MGGKSSDNSEMVNMQKEQAAEARQKEADRQARIDKGLAAITAAFEGSPVMATRAKNYTAAAPAAGTTSGTAVSGLPAGYTYKQISTGGGGGANTGRVVQYNTGGGHDFGPSGGATYSSTGTGRAGDGGSYSLTGGGQSGGGGTTKWVVVGPDGKQYDVGSQIGGTESYATGETTGGFDDSFYDKFKQSILDYYMPQVEDQYGKAKEQTTYGLARAGTLQSSAATDEAARLAKENKLNRANVVSQADTGAADLRSRVAQEKAKAESTLYATEDPDVAANQALAAVKDVSVAQPELSPLGQIFQTALIGGANAYTGARNQYLTNEYNKKRAATQVVA